MRNLTYPSPSPLVEILKFVLCPVGNVLRFIILSFISVLRLKWITLHNAPLRNGIIVILPNKITRWKLENESEINYRSKYLHVYEFSAI